MENNETISVIVPVYKVEQYLDQCVESIVGQTYRDLEIILVDDGSPDGCPALCDAWAARDSRIRVIHKANGGLSDARNAGMAASTGAYISFVDSDDWLEIDILDDALSYMEEVDAGIVAFGIAWEYPGRTEIPHPLQTMVYHGKDQIMRTYFESCMVRTTVWNKIYKRELLEKLTFPKGKLHEDEFFTYRALFRADIVASIEKIGYHYRQRANSIMGKFGLQHLDALDAMSGKEAFLAEKYPDMLPRFHREQLTACLGVYQAILHDLSADPDGKGRRYLYEYVKKIGFAMSDLKGSGWKAAVRHIGICLSVGGMAWVYTQIHRGR
ncbi:glycosyltransferase family 2 protein [uncultured Intestinimonas sp.]|uniref:glycosyltransferase family 2 protein n=1 Tax=uncultured Intestinimonas sp. TaxID=1689265 RepID=UPI002611A708|nr:glycosyltransferase family 2 protein [uncultured Intestinimonas sp.]